ncbi:MAG: DUF4403 family protein [Chitinophagaceae bacterium]|nr:DUF4403 family protein [Chitinophagaceae bacterium]
MKHIGSVFLMLIFLSSCSKKIIPEKPELAKTYFAPDSLPVSDIDIPLRVNLKPLYEIAEKNVQKIYASDGWPNEYIVNNCDTKYMYRFKRGPLRISSNGNMVNFNFTGSYIIAGAQRVCTGSGSDRVAISPWSPVCACGLKEAEPRVDIGYKANLQLKNNFNVVAKFEALNPKPLDKCTVCFWGHDITPIIMAQLKNELIIAGRDIEDSLNSLNFRPQFQQLWDVLNTSIKLYDVGYLQLNPEKIRMSSLYAQNDSLNISIGISARPLISLSKTTDHKTVIPDISDFTRRKGFSIYIDAIMNYDSLSQLLTKQLAGKRIDMDKLGKYIIIEKCNLYGADNEKLIIKVSFKGADNGIMYLTGKPVFNQAKNELQVKDIDYDIRTKSLLIKTAKWLFNRKIITELNKYSTFNMQAYTDTLISKVNSQMNRELQKGIFSVGKMEVIQIVNIYPLKNNFILRCNSKGDLAIQIDSFKL